jgi:Tfp pilus assembly protein PilN
MIKVNLLKDQTARVRKTFAKPSVSWIGLVYVAIFLLAAGSMAAWTYYVKQQITAGTEKRDQLQSQYEKLKELQKKIAAYDKLKQQRLDRIKVIERLKEDQSGPVLLLNAVIRSIPQNAELHLTSLTQKSDSVKIIGFTQQAEVIPDLMNNLAATGIFASVELELIERKDKDEASRFSLFCTSIKKPQAE